jgi:hypothetical protein
MNKIVFANRKILLLSGKSFLLPRKKQLPFVCNERPLEAPARICEISRPAKDGTLFGESRELFKEYYREWKKLFIPDEKRLF